MTSTVPDRGGRIVVGVDGSDGSKDALRWAMAQARCTGGTVEAINAWEDPTGYGFPYAWVSDSGDSLATLTEKMLVESVAEVADKLPDPVTVSTKAVRGQPAEVLVKAAVGATLLVVGSRGHGTFAGIVLGSVSQRCVAHAACPVLVVR